MYICSLASYCTVTDLIELSSKNCTLKPLHNIGKTKNKTVHRFTHNLHGDDGRKLSLKYLCLMCYGFRIISETRSNNEFSSRETKTPAIRMNTKNAECIFTVFS